MKAQKMLPFHSSSTRDKLGMGMQRERVASDNPEGWKGKKNCWQHCTDRFAQLACASFQLAAAPSYLGR